MIKNKPPRYKTHLPYDEFFTLCGLRLDKFLKRITTNIENANCGNCIRKKSIFTINDKERASLRRRRHENKLSKQSNDIK